ncbi:hypothetical protein EDI_258810, partial [Entamoeba dispar SAW760]
MVHLENVFLKNVLLYLPTLKDVGRFAQVCKSCEEAINTIYVNPYELTIHHSFDEIIPLFPNLQTFYVRRCPERLYKISANDIPLIEIGEWSESLQPTQVFNTKWFCSKIRKLRMTDFFYMKDTIKHPEYFTQLQELVILNNNDLNIIIKLLKLPTLKKVIIFCGMKEFQELSELFDFNKYKQINFVIIFVLTEYSCKNTKLIEINYNQFINCKFYTRIFTNLTINLPSLPSLPYEKSYGYNQRDAIDTINNNEILNEIYINNDTIIKNNIYSALIKQIWKEYELNTIDLTKLYIHSGIINAQKQNLVIIIPPNLKSLKVFNCQSSIDISKCHLKEIQFRDYKGKPLEVNDDNLEVFEINSSQQVKWYHNGTLLKQDEIFLDANKITSFKITYSNHFINDLNNNTKTIVFKYNDKETILNKIQFFDFEGYYIDFSCVNKQIDFSEYPFDSINIQESHINNLKVNCNSMDLNNVECDNLIIDGICDNINFEDCKINSIRCNIINSLNYVSQ